MQPASGARRPGNGLADTVVSVRTPGALKNVGWNACAAPQHRTAQDSAMSKVRIFAASSLCSLGRKKMQCFTSDDQLRMAEHWAFVLSS